jgi:fibro-slime domain-containing protein
VNNKLVVDLGGVHINGPLSATIMLDSLNLTSGKIYALDIFTAQRHTTVRIFVNAYILIFMYDF